jgi:hypothetical protein
MTKPEQPSESVESFLSSCERGNGIGIDRRDGRYHAGSLES